MVIKNFLLTESDNVVVAVISAYNNDDLNEKAKIALMEHFDCEIPTEINLEMSDYEYGNDGEFKVYVDYDAIIYIQEVVVY